MCFLVTTNILDKQGRNRIFFSLVHFLIPQHFLVTMPCFFLCRSGCHSWCWYFCGSPGCCPSNPLYNQCTCKWKVLSLSESCRYKLESLLPSDKVHLTCFYSTYFNSTAYSRNLGFGFDLQDISLSKQLIGGSSCSCTRRLKCLFFCFFLVTEPGTCTITALQWYLLCTYCNFSIWKHFSFSPDPGKTQIWCQNISPNGSQRVFYFIYYTNMCNNVIPNYTNDTNLAHWFKTSWLYFRLSRWKSCPVTGLTHVW